VEQLGKEFYRVPVPHDDPALAVYMADLLAEITSAGPAANGVLGPCRCTRSDGTWCTNGFREVAPSPYFPEA